MTTTIDRQFAAAASRHSNLFYSNCKWLNDEKHKTPEIGQILSAADTKEAHFSRESSLSTRGIGACVSSLSHYERDGAARARGGLFERFSVIFLSSIFLSRRDRPVTSKCLCESTLTQGVKRLMACFKHSSPHSNPLLQGETRQNNAILGFT